MIPIKGTNSRRVLDALRGVTRRTQNSLAMALSDIARPAILKILQDEIVAGNVAEKVSGFRLTAQAIASYHAEETASVSEYKDNFKPRGLQRAWSDEARRPGSLEFLSWQSRQL